MKKTVLLMSLAASLAACVSDNESSPYYLASSSAGIGTYSCGPSGAPEAVINTSISPKGKEMTLFFTISQEQKAPFNAIMYQEDNVWRGKFNGKYIVEWSYQPSKKNWLFTLEKAQTGKKRSSECEKVAMDAKTGNQ